MNNHHQLTISRALAVAAMLSFASVDNSRALNFSVPGTTSGPGKIDLGFYSGGSTLSLQVSGQVSLISGWLCYADGSLSSPVTAAGYGYANVGASGYPTLFGGDGINHYA